MTLILSGYIFQLLLLAVWVWKSVRKLAERDYSSAINLVGKKGMFISRVLAFVVAFLIFGCVPTVLFILMVLI